jgi:hypothetical protein
MSWDLVEVSQAGTFAVPLWRSEKASGAESGHGVAQDVGKNHGTEPSSSERSGHLMVLSWCSQRGGFSIRGQAGNPVSPPRTDSYTEGDRIRY